MLHWSIFLTLGFESLVSIKKIRNQLKRASSLFGGGQEYIINARTLFSNLTGCSKLKYHKRSSLKMLHWSIFLTLGFESLVSIKKIRNQLKRASSLFGGGQEIRTLAPVTRPTPLAGEPLHHLSNPPYLVNLLAERKGFEPLVPRGITSFQD